MSFFQSRIAAAAMMASLALPVLAQPAPSAVSAPPAATASAEQARKPGDRQERRQAYMAKRAEAFKAQLQLTPAQEPAWAAFTAAIVTRIGLTNFAWLAGLVAVCEVVRLLDPFGRKGVMSA